jgi:LacI family transcriptional regulator
LFLFHQRYFQRGFVLATIRDVAKLADVSLGTVSKVINGVDSVRPKLAERVAAAMQALDYHPNHVARSLKVRRTQTIGVLVSDVANPFFAGVMRGIEGEARIHGYAVIFSDSNEDPALEGTNLDTLFARRVDGALIIPTNAHTAQDHLARRRFPLVFIDRIPPSFTGSAVVADNLGAAFEATRHFISLGHERIAIITGTLTLSNGLDRLEGFRKALQQAGLPLHDDYLQQGDFLRESGYRCGLRLLQLPLPPTAILCCSNQMTLGLMRAMRERCIPCPDRVSILGFDDFDWAENVNPRLTTVAQPMLEMGRQAMQMLLRRMKSINEGVNGEEEKVVLKTELRVRDSTAPPPSASR